MLHQFTWLQFGIVAIILAIAWYLIVLLICFRREAQALVAVRNKDNKMPRVQAWETEEENWDEYESYDELMGRQAEEEHVSRVSFSSFGFAPKKEEVQATIESETDEEIKETQLGLVPDVLEELKSIFHILETENGGKDDFISLFALVSAKYPKIKGSPNQQALNDYIRDNVLFPISDEELDNLWV